MPLSHDHIRTTVETYLARHPHEREQLGSLLKALDRPTDIASRSTFPGHVTCGAIVIDPFGHVLHVLHLASGKVLAPGGHTEPEDESLAKAALRELQEETGIPPQAVDSWPGYETVPFDIDIHDVDAHPGKGEPSHQHFDLRFLFRLRAATDVPVVLQVEEVGGIEWRSMDRAASPSLREKLLKLPPVATTPSTAATDEATALRHKLADHLATKGHIRTPAVDHALRTVPRHAFAPGVALDAAYANDIVATRHSDDGSIISSVSAPWLQADMLEAARIRPGHHVLEIGSGGYNAALMAELVGPTGSVTTLDIDPVVTDRATRFLAQTGYDRVQVVTADAEHLDADIVPDGGFDAILVTVDTWDLPWIDALAEGGRLVAPLRLHGYHWAIGFTKGDGVLHSAEPLVVCGFVAMQGDGAWNPNRRTVPGTGVHLSWEDGSPLPVDQLAPALTREPTVTHSHVTVGGQEPFDALTLYLAGALPGFCRLSVDPDGDNGVLNPPPPHWPGAAIVRGASLARLATERVCDGDDGNGLYEFVVHGYGPHGHLAAKEMVEQVQHWQRNHRAALCPRITIHPLDTGAPETATGRPHMFVKKHTRVAIDWPTIPGTAALITDDDGRYLLHLRSANKPIWRPGHWALLGGNTEKGESCDEAIARELDEEIGLVIPDLTAFATLDTLDASEGFKDRVRVYHGTLNTLAHEIELNEGIQLRWTRIEEIDEMTMDPGTAAVLHAHHNMDQPGGRQDAALPVVEVREPRDHRSRSIIGAHLVLIRDGAVLLGQRHPDSVFAPSTWHLPAGHREDIESAVTCMVRETEEETGLRIPEGDLSLVHVLDLLDPGSTIPRMGLFFSPSQWEGEPVVREPECCTEWRWWPLDALPEPIVEYTRVALDAISNGTLYVPMGWS